MDEEGGEADGNAKAGAQTVYPAMNQSVEGVNKMILHRNKDLAKKS